jgi:hypothetical protein
MGDIKDSTIKNYLNTLIFCILAKAVTIGLLVLLLFDFAWKISFLILTVEVGLVLIICVTLYQIYKFNKRLEKLKEETLNAKPILNSCPDYFTKAIGASNLTYCNNTYNTPDKRFEYNFLAGTTPIANIELSSLTKHSLTMNDMCMSNTSRWEAVPWTDLKSRCGLLDSV